MKNKELPKRLRRRTATERYQRKQVRYYYNYYRHPVDVNRRAKDVLIRELFGFPEPRDGYLFATEGLRPDQLGRFRTLSFDDCGKSKCPLCCNPRKQYKYRTLKEKVHDIEFKEGMREYYDCLYMRECESEDFARCHTTRLRHT